MDTKDLPRPLTEEQAAEEATADFIKGQYAGMSDNMAGLWARAIAIEEQTGRNENKAEMAGDLREHIEAALVKAAPALEAADKEMIRQGYRESLEKNDFFEARMLMGVAEEDGIDVSDIESAVVTNLSFEELRSDEIPLSCIA